MKLKNLVVKTAATWAPGMFRPMMVAPTSTRSLSATASASPPTTADVVIVGAGLVGASIALAMSRMGYRTVNVDPHSGSGNGSTSYSSGCVRTYYSVVDTTRMALEGYSYYEDWENYIGVEDPLGVSRMKTIGALVLKSPELMQFVGKSTKCADEVGIPYEHWTNQQIKDTYPAFSTAMHGPCRMIDHPDFGTPRGELDGAVFYPKTGYVSDPRLTVHNMQVAAEATGKARFLFNRSVSGFITSKNGSGASVGGVELSNGDRIHAPIVVNAAGPYSGTINNMLFGAVGPEFDDMKVKARPLRQEVAYLRLPSGTDAHGFLPMVTDDDSGVYMRPETGGKILVGSGEPLCEDMQWIDNPAECNMGLTDRHTNLVYRALLRFPGLGVPSSADTMGITAMYDATPDFSPIFDSSAVRGYFMAIGTSGNQFKNGGVIGPLMATLIDKVAHGHDHDIDPVVFMTTKSKTPGPIHLKSFSRLRSLLGTTGNVLG